MRIGLIVLAVAACGGGTGAGAADGATVDGAPAVPAGCITEATAGDHEFTCGGLRVDARVPAACTTGGCGLILEVHGDTGNGLLMDGHTQLRALGEQRGYVVIAPTGTPYGFGLPGSTWRAANDATLVEMVRLFVSVFRIDRKRVHVTGFSRGGFVTWRLLCDHAELFASAAPAGAGDGAGFREETCFTPGRMPSRQIPIAFLMGRTDASVGYASMTKIRDAAVARYGAAAPVVLGGDAAYTHSRWTASGGSEGATEGVIETWDHAYETVSPGPFASAKGHCIAGSTTDPQAPQYAIPCKLPNAFTWGEQVMAFFVAHPMP